MPNQAAPTSCALPYFYDTLYTSSYAPRTKAVFPTLDVPLSETCSLNPVEPDSSKTKYQLASAYQVNALNRVFERTSLPSKDLRQKLADLLGMQRHKVQIWFQNRRQKFQRKKGDVSKRGRKQLLFKPHIDFSTCLTIEEVLLKIPIQNESSSASVPNEFIRTQYQGTSTSNDVAQFHRTVLSKSPLSYDRPLTAHKVLEPFRLISCDQSYPIQNVHIMKPSFSTAAPRAPGLQEIEWSPDSTPTPRMF